MKNPAMTTEDPVKLVSDLELAFPQHKVDLLETKDPLSIAFESAQQENEESFMSNKGLISFVSEVEGQNRKDVLNSVLIAQLAADKQFPVTDEITPEEMKNWYKEFNRVMRGVGWTIESEEFSKFESSKSVFEMENVILDILGTAIGGSALKIVMKTLEAFKKMSDSDNKLIAFEKNTHTMNKGNFQVGLANQTNESLSLNLTAFTLSTSKMIKQILFFKSSKDETEVNTYSMKYTLNKEVYEQVRDMIIEKLGSNVQSFVTEIEI
ncbi:hypothetical protein OO013_09745 [Mangrovivirga sp. M17]|uniref:Uncharacterized protein n=1 Tax=Mangrovivirga halotolerans TaxID=2993936 RepID=A0ABT3RQV3_9BACT|nr:hypothetical protein [Mangrovivirga halotolerans]MCX2744149.1 hypothetical protein [Mangrovivirga halotolerans]